MTAENVSIGFRHVMLIGGWWPRLRAACDPPLPFVLSPSLVGVPLVGTRPPPTPTLRGESVHELAEEPALSFVEGARSKSFRRPASNHHPGSRVASPTRPSSYPPPSRRPRPGPSSNQATPAQPANPISLHTQPSIPPLSPSSPSSLTTHYSPLTPRYLVVSLPKGPVPAATKPNRAETNSARRGPDTQARSKLFRSTPRSRMIARIVPVRRSLPPQFGIVVRVPFAGFRQISCEPRDWRSNSQPSDLNLRVNSR